jgi:hypothetical protein
MIARAGLFVVAATSVAHAGARDHAWLDAAEVSDEPTVLEATISEHDDLGEAHRRSTSLVLAPGFAIGEHTQLLVPVAFSRDVELGLAPATSLAWFAVEARYQALASSTSAVALRSALVRDVAIRDLVRLELGSAARVDRGALRVTLDGGATLEANPGGVNAVLHPGAGVSWRASPAWRLGASAYGDVALGPASTTWFAVGPDLAWRRDRAWLSASFGVGIDGIAFAPRIAWSLAL